MKVLEGNKEYEISKKENGDKFQYYKGKLHRELGPAIELASGAKVWYFEGNKITSEGQKTFENKIKLIKTATHNKYYTVRIETMLPATLHYRVLASSPEEAFIKIKHIQPNEVHHKLNGRKDIKATVYDYGTLVVKLIRHLIGH